MRVLTDDVRATLTALPGYEHQYAAALYPENKILKDLLSEDQARFEVAGEHHHDHFICEHCGKIVEFEDDAIERMQQDVAKKLGVVMTRHKLEFYGLCHDCRRLR